MWVSYICISSTSLKRKLAPKFKFACYWYSIAGRAAGAVCFSGSFMCWWLPAWCNRSTLLTREVWLLKCSDGSTCSICLLNCEGNHQNTFWYLYLISLSGNQYLLDIFIQVLVCIVVFKLFVGRMGNSDYMTQCFSQMLLFSIIFLLFEYRLH